MANEIKLRKMPCDKVRKEYKETLLDLETKEFDKEKELGVVINNRQSPENHINEKQGTCIMF